MAQTNLNWKACSVGVIIGLGGAVVCVALGVNVGSNKAGEFYLLIPFVFPVALIVGTIIGTFVYPNR